MKRKEPIELWVRRHFSLRVDELLQTMYKKPLREYLGVFSRDNKCAFNCSHCFMVEDDKDENFQPEKDIRHLLSSKNPLLNHSETYVYWQEPAMHLEEFIKILSEFPQNIIEIDPTIFIKRPGLLDIFRNLGITWIGYSIHGDYESHKSLTNQSKKRWEMLIEGVRTVIAAGFQVGLSSCIYKGNADRIEGIAETINSIEGLGEWSVNRIVPGGRARHWSMDKFLYSDECGPVVRRLARCFGYMDNVESCIFDTTWGPNFYGDQGKALLGSRCEIERGVYNCHTASDIQLGIRNFWVSRFTGHVYPCVYACGIPQLRIGQLENGEIKMDKERLQKYLPENRLGKLMGICSPETCGFTSICVGCPTVAYLFSSKINKTNAITGSEGLDFCITKYIQENCQDPELLGDLAAVITYAPVNPDIKK